MRFRGGSIPSGNTLVDQGIHPRLWFTTNTNSHGVQTTADVRSKLATHYANTSSYPDIDGTLEAIIAEIETDMPNPATKTRAEYYGAMHALMSQVLKAGALGGSTKTAAEHGARASALMQAWVDGGLGDPADASPGFPFLYDWAYEYHSAGQIAAAHTTMAAYFTYAENNWAQSTRRWAADNSKEMSLSVNMATAAAGDGDATFNAAAALALSRYATRVASATGIIGEKSVVALTGATGMLGTSGDNYTAYEWAWWVMAAEAHRTAATTQTRASFYASADYAAIPSVFYGLLWSIRPFAKTDAFWANGIEWLVNRNNYTELKQNGINLARGLIQGFAGIWNSIDTTTARHAMWYHRERIGGSVGSVIGEPASSFRIGRTWLARFLLEDPTISPLAPNGSMPTTSGRIGDGRYEFRSGWDDAATTNTHWVVRFWLPKYLMLYDGRGAHEMVGHHDVMYRGPATIIRGPSSHMWAGHGAFNLLYFRDTTATLGSDFVTNYVFKLYGRPISGSATYASNRGEDIFDGSQADYLDEVRERLSGGNIDSEYVYGDITRWYASDVAGGWSNANNDPITTLCHVHFCLFRFSSSDPIYVVKAYRYTTKSTRFEPCVVWNPSGDSITVNGTETANQPVRWNGGAGHWRSTDTTQAVAVQDNIYGSLTFNNKNVATIVRPASAQVVRAGGPHSTNGAFYNDPLLGTNSDISTENSYEAMDLYGQPWTRYSYADDDEDYKGHHGQYHIQIQPNTISTSGDFLMVNEVMPNSAGTPATIEALTNESNNWAGCAILSSAGRRIFAFNTAGDASSGSFQVRSSGTYKMKIVNLADTSRTFTASGGATLTKLEDGSGASGSTFSIHVSKSQDFTLTAGSTGCVITISS